MKRLDTISQEQALEILGKVQLFDNFSDCEKDTLTGFHSHFFLAPKGTVLIKEGAFDDSFYILLSGKLSVRKQAAKHPLANLNPGDCFGEVSFLTEQKRTTSITCLSDSIFFEIDKPTLNHLDANIRERLKDNLIRVLAERLDHMNEVVAKLSNRVA